MRRARDALGIRSALAIFVSLLLFAAAPAAGARPAAYPTLPIPLDRHFLGNLSAPTIAPGASTELGYSVANPASLGAPLVDVRLTFQVYAFNGYPGDATALLPVTNAPVLSNSSASGTNVSVAVGTIASGAVRTGTIGIQTSPDTPAGTFAIRTAVSFLLGATPYRLESRGWFSAALWDRATTEPNGSATLNLTLLGVSGVVPETAVLVASSDWSWALGALLAGAFVLLAAGAWVYSRRGPGSTSGTG